MNFGIWLLRAVPMSNMSSLSSDWYAFWAMGYSWVGINWGTTGISSYIVSRFLLFLLKASYSSRSFPNLDGLKSPAFMSLIMSWVNLDLNWHGQPTLSSPVFFLPQILHEVCLFLLSLTDSHPEHFHCMRACLAFISLTLCWVMMVVLLRLGSNLQYLHASFLSASFPSYLLILQHSLQNQQPPGTSCFSWLPMVTV